jgi:hypothetical protein
MKMKTAPRSYFAGMHNPILHSATVIIAWIKIYKHSPSIKESICILVHDIGYLKQTSLDGSDNRHPELGAMMAQTAFGKKYYELCLAHSRDYAKKYKTPLSKLGYADKYSILILPNWIFNLLIHLGGEAEEYHRTTKTNKWGKPIDVKRIKADYQKWFAKQELKTN